MQKLMATMAVMVVAALTASSLHANFTVFDLSKDSVHVARGEFTSLQRTQAGDRLTLRCDEVIKGSLTAGDKVVLEPFEKAPSDEALGREVIVFFFPFTDGKNYFMNQPFAWRSFVFETDDVAVNGLDQNELAIRNFLAINMPHEKAILSELGKRQEYQDQSYAGKFEQVLINEWKAELLNQMSWTGTRAARDAAKCLCESELFKGKLTESELQTVGALLPSSTAGDLGRAYMLELVRNQNNAHPTFAQQMNMLREETSQACVGKLSNLMLAIEDRAMVLESVGTLAANRLAGSQPRVNALQMLQALADTDGLPHVHQTILAELSASDFDKNVMRRALSALRSTPDASNVPVLNQCLSSAVFLESWELTRRAWVAYAMVDNQETNNTLMQKFMAANTQGMRFWFKKLLPENKIIRKLIMIHNED